MVVQQKLRLYRTRLATVVRFVTVRNVVCLPIRSSDDWRHANSLLALHLCVLSSSRRLSVHFLQPPMATQAAAQPAASSTADHKLILDVGNESEDDFKYEAVDVPRWAGKERARHTIYSTLALQNTQTKEISTL
jgi:hypothetical protein